ncbi:MAG: hypothetical protein RLZZ562_1287, partial [Planctomycetota bacterium]
MSALGWLLAVATCVPQGQEPMFAVADATVDGVTRTTIASDRRAISCLDALQGLAVAMGWNIRIESKPLENDLQFCTVDLSFAGQDARMTAQLIAVAAGGDVVFDEGDGRDG